jgi:nucleoside-diphosphate-sugar epimerase
MVEIMSGCLHELYGAPLHTARLGLVYGPGDDNLTRVVPTVITSLLSGRSPRLSSGRRRFDWVYIDDVTRGLLAMAAVDTLPAPALDLGSGTLCSVREVAETIAALSGATCPVLFDPALDRPHEQERCADLRAAHSALRLGPATELREGLSRTITWYAHTLTACSAERRDLRQPIR